MNKKKEVIKIYERIYDNAKKEDGTDKPNKLLGEFELLEGDMNDYSYVVFVKDNTGEVYKLIGQEVSGFYHPNEGGTRNVLSKLSESADVKAYLKFK
jgi:hypothetical protein